MYRTVVTTCTTNFHLHNFYVLPAHYVCVCVLYGISCFEIETENVLLKAKQCHTVHCAPTLPSVQIKIYRTIILPVVLYGCETWSLTLREERRLRVF